MNNNNNNNKTFSKKEYIRELCHTTATPQRGNIHGS